MKKQKTEKLKHKIPKTNNGITLIALVITIIVMLILVAVTISMAVNGGLFDYAGKAVGETKNAIDKEQELANGGLNIAGTWYNSIDEYINGEKTDEIDWEAILADANANPDKYLQQAAKVGQDIEENTAIGIGTNVKVVNMDLWTFKEGSVPGYGNRNDGGIVLTNGFNDGGMWCNTGPAYLGAETSGIVIPQYISDGDEFLPVTWLEYTFWNCEFLVEPPEIPTTVKWLDSTFIGCTSLETVPEIPESVTSMCVAFSGCTSLTGTIKINAENVNDFDDMLFDVTNQLTIQVPANSTTYDTLYEEYGEVENIIIETF